MCFQTTVKNRKRAKNPPETGARASVHNMNEKDVADNVEHATTLVVTEQRKTAVSKRMKNMALIRCNYDVAFIPLGGESRAWCRRRALWEGRHRPGRPSLQPVKRSKWWSRWLEYVWIEQSKRHEQGFGRYDEAGSASRRDSLRSIIPSQVRGPFIGRKRSASQYHREFWRVRCQQQWVRKCKAAVVV